jgi:hypothetical protein
MKFSYNRRRLGIKGKFLAVAMSSIVKICLFLQIPESGKMDELFPIYEKLMEGRGEP